MEWRFQGRAVCRYARDCEIAKEKAGEK